MRELQHVLERAVILGRGKSLELGELLPRAKSSSKPSAAPAADEPLPTLASKLEAFVLRGTRRDNPARRSR